VHTAELPATGLGAVEWQLSAAESGFIRTEVRDRNGDMAAMSNPVILA
jgi:hypothetical protein